MLQGLGAAQAASDRTQRLQQRGDGWAVGRLLQAAYGIHQQR
jgi:hypothetical protein